MEQLDIKIFEFQLW